MANCTKVIFDASKSTDFLVIFKLQYQKFRKTEPTA